MTISSAVVLKFKQLKFKKMHEYVQHVEFCQSHIKQNTTYVEFNRTLQDAHYNVITEFSLTPKYTFKQLKPSRFALNLLKVDFSTSVSNILLYFLVSHNIFLNKAI